MTTSKQNQTARNIHIPRLTEQIIKREMAYNDVTLQSQPFVLYNSPEHVRPEHHTGGMTLRGLPEVMSHVSGEDGREWVSYVAFALLCTELQVPERPVRLEMEGKRFWLAPGQRTIPPVMTHGIHLQKQGMNVRMLILNAESDTEKPKGNTRLWRDPAPRARDTPILTLPPLKELHDRTLALYPRTIFSLKGGLISAAPTVSDAMETVTTMEIVFRIEAALTGPMNRPDIISEIELNLSPHSCHPLLRCPGSGGILSLTLRGVTCEWITDARLSELPAGTLSGQGDAETLKLIAQLCGHLGHAGCLTSSDELLDTLMETDLVLSPRNGAWHIGSDSRPNGPVMTLAPLIWHKEMELQKQEGSVPPVCSLNGEAQP